MTDTTTETRDLIARVRDGIAPADQPQALRDLARTADGDPRVDAGMLRREAEIIRLRARVAELEAESLAAAVALAQADSEADEICDRLSDVLGEACGPHAPMSVSEIVDAIEREVCRFKEDLATAYQRGQEAMREQAARACFALAYGADWPSELEQAVCNAYMNAGTVVRALPLDDDAREDAGLVCGACGTPMSSSAADAVAYSGFPPAEGLSRPSCCDAAYPANAREDAQGDDNGR